MGGEILQQSLGCGEGVSGRPPSYKVGGTKVMKTDLRSGHDVSADEDIGRNR
jgi:hypothetical protein